jgi:hypothetical protein
MSDLVNFNNDEVQFGSILENAKNSNLNWNAIEFVPTEFVRNVIVPTSNSFNGKDPKNPLNDKKKPEENYSIDGSDEFGNSILNHLGL